MVSSVHSYFGGTRVNRQARIRMFGLGAALRVALTQGGVRL